MEYKETGKVRTFDGAEIHHRIVPSSTSGVWPREVLEDIRTRGAEAPIDVKSSALFRIKAYAAVPLDPDSMLTALSATGPVQVVTWLGQAFGDQWNNRINEYIPAPPSRDEGGLHSMLIVAGDRARGAVIQNTWGIDGGSPFKSVSRGVHQVSWAWLAMQGCGAWALTDSSNATEDGWIRTHEENVREDGWSLVKRPDRPAVYAVINQSRDWISSQHELYSRGLGGRRVTVKDKSDAVWGYPVVGGDAPEGSRA